MKVFVATREMQGTREGDEFLGDGEGKLVYFGGRCCGGPGFLDKPCSCLRSMTGFDAAVSTTTFKVADIGMSLDEFYEKYIYVMTDGEDIDKDEWESSIDAWKRDADLLLDAANTFPEGLVLERRDRDIQPRNEFNFTFPFDD
jgi:hypothetical protein